MDPAVIWRDIAGDLAIVGAAIQPYRQLHPLTGELVDTLSSLAQVTLELHQASPQGPGGADNAGVPPTLD